MGLYVDSAYIDDVASISESFPIAGVTTNPTILLRALERGQKLDDLEILQRLLDATAGLVFMQPTAPDAEHLRAAASRYLRHRSRTGRAEATANRDRAGYRA